MRVGALLCALALCASLSAARGQTISAEEREGLIDVYNAAGGPNWFVAESWLGPPGTECEWPGVQCDCFEDEDGSCRLYVSGLTIPGPAVGVLPAGIRKLRHLRELESFDLGGPLPRALGRLTALRFLKLIGHFEGELPPGLGQLEHLRYLALTGEMTGRLPRTLSRLRDLEVLVLDGRFEGSIPPELGRLSKLYELELVANLSGPIPAELGGLRRLERLLLAFNKLTGNIPPSLGALASLRFVGLDGNQLSGDVPSAVLTWANCEVINIGFNAFIATNPEVSAFLQDRGLFNDWRGAQTLPPRNLRARLEGGGVLRLEWQRPIFYGVLVGGYIVEVAGRSNEVYRPIARIEGKERTEVVLALPAGFRHGLVRLRSFSLPHSDNSSTVRSVPSNAVEF